MKKKLFWLMSALLMIAMLPWGGPSVDAQDSASAEPLYVALIWHQHQPVYFQDPTTGIYQRPWVRVHASKDYLDMVAILEDYPDVHATFNLTPSLIRQIEDFNAGAKDLYWVLSETPVSELSEDDKRFILERFFDANPKMIARFPRYQELADMRGGASDGQIDAALASWTDADFTDLQMMFNLAWTDPSFLAEEPLATLVTKERGYTYEDIAIVFDEHRRIMEAVLPTHRALQDAGQIEVTMTPFAHPILPLLVDSNVAAVGMPEAELPERFVYGQDAVQHVQRGVELYETHFGRPPRGMWPAEGSVSQQIIEMTRSAGINWIATDEFVLARSLPEIEDFTRNTEGTIQQPDLLYRPYTVTGRRGGELSILFRDHIISDLIGFEYSGTPGQEAADDLMRRLENIQAELAASEAEGPNLVTILLDGENAWEHYDNDGIEFLRAMYQGFSDSENIVTVTPSEYLEMTERPNDLEELFPGSWITPDFSTWIGEEEENLGWSYLLQMREDVKDVESELDEETLAQVMELVYIAEGSDWFWWYGADQNSGRDEDFDTQFRQYLAQIYDLIGQEPPNFVNVPIIAQPSQTPTREAGDIMTVELDGIGGEDEWANAAFYEEAGFYHGFDAENLYLRLDGVSDGTYGFYLRVPDRDPANATPRNADDFVGFGARRLLEVTVSDESAMAALFVSDGDGGWNPIEGAVIDSLALSDGVLEVQAPLAVLSPAARSGDRIDVRLFTDGTLIPADGPALAVVPDLGVPNVFLTVADPAEDDNGPGTYIYPTDGVFRTGAYDLVEFVAGQDDETVVLQVTLRGSLVNEWGSPNGMGILTVDVYIDTDGAANGMRMLLPGRNAALTPDFAWDYAAFAEGWEPALFGAGEDGAVVISNSAMQIVSNPGQRRVTIRIPKSLLAEGDPAGWSYLVTAASQEGFPSAGVLRIRDVEEANAQYTIGGSLGGRNATRLMDVILPEGASQAELLSAYEPVDGSLEDLTPDDFAVLPMVGVE